MLGGDPRFAAAADELDEAIRLLRSPTKTDDAIRNASHALDTLDVIGKTLGWCLPAHRTLHGQLVAAKANNLLGAREADALGIHFTRLVDGAVGGARNTEPGAGHGQGTGMQSDPMMPNLWSIQRAQPRSCFTRPSSESRDSAGRERTSEWRLRLCAGA